MTEYTPVLGLAKDPTGTVGPGWWERVQDNWDTIDGAGFIGSAADQDITVVPLYNGGDRQPWLTVRVEQPADWFSDPDSATHWSGSHGYGLRIYVENGGMSPISTWQYGDDYPRVGFVGESIEFSQGSSRPNAVMEMMANKAFGLTTGLSSFDTRRDVPTLHLRQNSVDDKYGDALVIDDLRDGLAFSTIGAFGHIDLAAAGSEYLGEGQSRPAWLRVGRGTKKGSFNDDKILLSLDTGGRRGGIGGVDGAPVLFHSQESYLFFVEENAIATPASTQATRWFRAGKQSGGRPVVYMGNAVVLPTSNPSSGFLLYSEGGVGRVRSAAGRIGDLGAPLHTKRKRTSGDLTLAVQTWSDVDNAQDITLKAKVGDWVEVGMSGAWSDNPVAACLDIVSVVSGLPVNSWANDAAPDNSHQGVLAWFGLASAIGPFGGSLVKQIVAGDLSGGNVVLRIRGRTTGLGTKTLFSSAVNPLHFWARNLGAAS